MKRVEFPDGHEVERGETEGARMDEALEAGDRHSIEASGDFGEAGGAVLLEIGAPADEGFFAEQEMGPREDGEQVATHGVIPGRTEADPDFSVGGEHGIHFAEDKFGIVEVFEGVDGEDEGGFFGRADDKLAKMLDAGPAGETAAGGMQFLANFDAENLGGAVAGEFNDLFPFAATEISDNFSRKEGEDVLSEDGGEAGRAGELNFGGQVGTSGPPTFQKPVLQLREQTPIVADQRAG